MIVVPKEVWNPASNDTIYKVLESQKPLDLFTVKQWTRPANEHPMRDFLRHLRNAVSHVNFSLDSDGNFEFWDKNGSGVENYRVFIARDDLAAFLSTVGAALANLRSR